MHRLILNYLDNNKAGQKGVQYLIKSCLHQLEKLELGNFSLELESCELVDENINQLTKGQWPNLAVLRLSKYKSILGKNKGVSPSCLTHLDKIKWILKKLLVFWS